MKHIIVLLGLLSFQSTHASLVKCWIKDNPKYYVSLAFNSERKIVSATPKHFVLADKEKNSPFSLFRLETDSTGFEAINTFIARHNGYSIVEFITTMDVLTFGVSTDKKTGFFKYRDIGSGNGNKQYDLICR